MKGVLGESCCTVCVYVTVWFVRMYGKIIHELKRVDYLPYIRTTIQ